MEIEIDKCTSVCIIVFLGPSMDRAIPRYRLIEYLDDPTSVRPLIKLSKMDRVCSMIRFGLDPKIDTEKSHEYGISLKDVMTGALGSFDETIVGMVLASYPEWSKRIPQLSGCSYDQVRSVLGLLPTPPSFARDHSNLAEVFYKPMILRGGKWFVGPPPFVDVGLLLVNKNVWKDFLKAVFLYFQTPYTEKYWINPNVSASSPAHGGIEINICYEFFGTKKDVSTCVATIDDSWSGLVWCMGVVLEKLELRVVNKKYHKFVDTTLMPL